MIEEIKTKNCTPCCHLNYDNKQDCENIADKMCMCCSSPRCEEHADGKCQYGGMGFIDIPGVD
jgi:hypothetical protein